jgi:hypothetical protein
MVLSTGRITTACSGRATQRLSQDKVLCAPLMPGVRTGLKLQPEGSEASLRLQSGAV